MSRYDDRTKDDTYEWLTAAYEDSGMTPAEFLKLLMEWITEYLFPA